MLKTFLAVCVVVFLAGVAAMPGRGGKGKYKQLIVGDFCVKIEGKSGKITIMRTIEEVVNATGNYTEPNARKKMKTRKPKPCEGKKKITVDFEGLVELNENGTELDSKSGPGRKHKFKDFAKHEFNVSEPRFAMYQELSAYEVAFSSKINGAYFKVKIYIFNETGNITNGEEVKTVARGTVKFTIEINNWLFCGSNGSSCKKPRRGEAIGKYLEIELKIKGKKEKPDDKEEKRKKKEEEDKKRKEKEEEKGKGKDDDDDEKPNKGDNDKKKKRNESYRCKKRCGKQYDMGDNDEVVLFKSVMVDGMYVDMPEGFPNLRKKGSSYVFVLRLPRGQNITYDPTVAISADEVPLTPDDGENTDGGNDNGDNKDNNKDNNGGGGGGEGGSSSVSSTCLLVAAMSLMSLLFKA